MRLAAARDPGRSSRPRNLPAGSGAAAAEERARRLSASLVPEARRRSRRPAARAALRKAERSAWDRTSPRAQLPGFADEAAHRGLAAARGHAPPAQGRDPAPARCRGRRLPLARSLTRPTGRTATFSRVRDGPRSGNAAALRRAPRRRLALGRRAAGPRQRTRGRSTRRSSGRSRSARRTLGRPTSGTSSRTASAAHWRLFDDDELARRALAPHAGPAGRGDVQYVEFRGWPVPRRSRPRPAWRGPELGVKFIPVAGRRGDRAGAKRQLDETLARRERDPSLVAGFDLVEEEDPLAQHALLRGGVPRARAARRRPRGLSLPAVPPFGRDATARKSENLDDAFLLGAPRIGHGLALVRHPVLMETGARARCRDRGLPDQQPGARRRARPAQPPGRRRTSTPGFPFVLAPDDPGADATPVLLRLLRGVRWPGSSTCASSSSSP